MESTETQQGRRVVYFLEDDLSSFSYGKDHPFKPIRYKFTDELVNSYGLLPYLEVFRPQHATEHQLTMFHNDDYVSFLQRISPTNTNSHANLIKKYNLDRDNPIFADLYEYCQLYTGASLGCAYRINKKLCDIAINWSGGATHAKKTHAHGFNYINDVVLTILELLKHHKRVLYLDLGITHCDGVEEAFYHTNRVLSLSLHKYGDFFPGTGHCDDVGAERGTGFSINCPLRAGLSDEQHSVIFSHSFNLAIKKFKPDVVVVSCGVDGIWGDQLGVWNLTGKSILHAIQKVLDLNLPTVLLGGGGSNPTTCARIWTQITAMCLGKVIEDDIPHNLFYEHYTPSFSLQTQPLTPDNIHLNTNSTQDIIVLLDKITHNINKIEQIPHVTYPIPFNEIIQSGLTYDDQKNINNDNDDDMGGTKVV